MEEATPSAISQPIVSPPLGISVLLMFVGFVLGTIIAFKLSDAKFGADVMNLQVSVIAYATVAIVASGIWLGVILVLALSVKVNAGIRNKRRVTSALAINLAAYILMFICYWNINIYDVSWTGDCSPPNITYNSYTGMSLGDSVAIRYGVGDEYRVKHADLPWSFTAISLDCSSGTVKASRIGSRTRFSK